MGGAKSFPAWDALCEKLSTRHRLGKPVRSAPISMCNPTGSNAESLELVGKFSDGLDDDTWTTISRYYRYGGVDNLKNLLGFFYNHTRNDKSICWPPPLDSRPMKGCIIRIQGYIPDPEAYIETTWILKNPRWASGFTRTFLRPITKPTLMP